MRRFVRIFEAFTETDTVLSVSEIARRSGLHVATASRLIGQLADEGLLTRDPDGQVRLGLRIWELAARAQPALSLREAALPFMQVLHAGIRQHTQLGVRDGREVVFLERLSWPGATVNFTRVATRLPLTLSSSGLVLLAHAGTDLLEQVLSEPLPAATPDSIVDPSALRRFLAMVRREGYALCPGFLHADTTGLAAPLRGRDGQVVGAMSLVVPRDDRARMALGFLVESARQTSTVLGARSARSRVS
ncbi:IclR family transcriptional regulator [Metallococcus carri]|uniref:IclR family transcriptional regulator n=1 Tax=Metallococcus carri TaxID=1656884 RepID=UPI001A9E754D|nr:IclR family transcriptional regulator [Metallococcus carri]